MTTDAFLIMTPYRPRSFWMGARMLFEKDGKRNSNTEWRIYYSDDVLPSSSPRVYKSFTFVQDDILRLSSPQRQTLHIRLGWQLTIFLATSVQILHVRSGRRLTFPSLWRLFLQLSFWTGARMLFEKDGKRNSNTEWRIYYSDDVLPSSSPRVYKSFTFVQDDDWRFPHYDALPSPVILNEDKNAVGESQKTATWHRVKNLLLGWRLAANS